MSATNRGLERVANDHYPTPTWLTRAVLPTLEERLKRIDAWPNARIYEPACGVELALVNTMREKWPDVDIEYSDIIPMHGGVDFLVETPEPIFDLIITNPPYLYAQEFMERAKLWRKTEQSLIVLLLRINFLGAKKRATWLRSNLPSLSVSPKRPSMGLNKHGKPGTDATEYAWFIWPQEAPYLEILETENIEGK